VVEVENLTVDVPRLQWQLSWSSDDRETDSAAATFGVLTISVGGEAIWGTEDGNWPWIDLLDWLVRSWVWLRGEDGLPGAVRSDAPSLGSLLASLESATPSEPLPSPSRASMDFWNFQETHDLSRALAGAEAPAILVWREGLMAHVMTAQNRYSTSWSDISSSLIEIGDTIARRLEHFEVSDARARYLIRGWSSRDHKPTSRWLAMARRSSSPSVAPLPDSWNDVDLGEIERSPILAAARMTSRFPVALADAILEKINNLSYRETPIADIAAEVTKQANLGQSNRPFEQAHAFALAFRDHVGLAHDAPFGPEAWLSTVGVQVTDVHLGERTVEAVAAWGPQNGPAILINRDGTASSGVRGRNASLVHEIGHLMMDRTSSLPAAEVLGGGVVNPAIEQRARAFAAEVLLPRAIAGSQFSSIAEEHRARKAVNSLEARYAVSGEIVAWQARNSGAVLNAEVYEYLRTLVSRPDRF
jgi:Zn-dependent peptidase ImmA (M78 family)